MTALLCMLAGCAALGLAPAANSQQTIAYAYSDLTAVMTTAAQLAQSGAISRTVAGNVNVALIAVKDTLDAAESASTSSAPVAVSVITAATATLASIATYLTCQQQKGPSCQL